MVLIEWKDRYRVGNEAVDHEHRELIDLINGLDEELKSGTSQRTVEEILGDLFRGISAHFALEERFMRDHGYDHYLEHKGAHERLLDEIRDIMDGYEADPENASQRLGRELDVWFTDHFKTHDARLHGRLGAHPH
jgi:hemerythrin-like metal-binding protein